jgi:Killing trait
MAEPTAVNSQITDAVNPQITDAVATSSVSSIASQPAMLSNLMLANLIANTNLSQQNAIANQQAMNELGVAILGKSVNLLTTLGPIEAMSVQQVLTGNVVAEDIADLRAALQAVGETNGAEVPPAPKA